MTLGSASSSSKANAKPRKTAASKKLTVALPAHAAALPVLVVEDGDLQMASYALTFPKKSATGSGECQ